MVLLGLVGKKRVGKDTLADYLVSHHHYTKRAFAAPIKEACALLFQVPTSSFEDVCEKERVVARHGMSPRTMMQMVGTDMFRKQVHQDFWLRHFVEWYHHSAKHQTQNVVVTDIRFQNELDLIKELGGTVVRVVRPGQLEDEDTHVSEQGVDSLVGVDMTIENSGTKEDLWANVLGLMRSGLAQKFSSH